MKTVPTSDCKHVNISKRFMHSYTTGTMVNGVYSGYIEDLYDCKCAICNECYILYIPSKTKTIRDLHNAELDKWIEKVKDRDTQIEDLKESVTELARRLKEVNNEN